MVKTIVVALLIAAAALASKSTEAETVDSMEIYPGVSQAVAQTVAETYRPNLTWQGVEPLPEKEILPPDDEVDTRITFYGGGVSDHRRSSTKNESYKQKNGMLGIGLSTAESWYGIRPIAQWVHVFDNSRKGSTDMKGVGLELCYEFVLEMCYSRIKAYAKITDNKGNSISQWVPKPVPTLSLGKGPFLVAVTGIDNKTSFVFLGYRKEFNLF
ncbi:MAG: hypothetical protein KBC50_00070 [Candidatus Pacebacteria bacterium]|nr:hypothetical protein [Candidatus Paceibacterota bacterium]